MRTSLFAAVGVIAAATAPARADNTNRNLLPIGEREAAMANAGITSASGAAVFYNPANLARIPHATLSMSGTTLLRFELSTDAFLEIDGVDQPFDASGFVSIPASLVSTYAVGEFTAATAVLVPDAFSLENRLTLDLEPLKSTLLQTLSQQDLWLGASLARSFSDVSVGLSLFGVQRTSSSVTVFNVLSPEMDAATSSISSQETSVLGLTAVAGAHWQVTPAVGIGLRAQSPLIRITGSANIYESTVSAGAMDSVEEFEREDAAYRDPLPWDLGVGIALSPTPRLEIVLDANLQLPDESQRLLDDDLAGPDVVLEAAFRASLGAELTLTDSMKAQLGLLYNGSAEPEPEVQGDSFEDYLGVTVGLSRTSGRTRTGLGVFFMQSSGELIPIGASDARRVDIQSRLVGGLITAAYLL